MLTSVKTALRIATTAYDEELNSLIAAAVADLGIIGVNNPVTDPLIKRAVITYVRINFGSPDDYDRLKAAYDEQKAQLLTATGYGIDEEAFA